MIGIAAMIVALGFVAVALHRKAEAESARAIALHLIGTIVPALERKGYQTIRKLVAFGAEPAVSVSMVGSSGLWIEMEANRHTAHFVIHSGTETTDNPDLRFEVSGPWDELTVKRLASWERTFESWQANGGRFASLADAPGPFVTFYLPAQATYRRVGHETASSPTDPSYKLDRLMERASPRDRYPLVPRLPSG